MPPGDQLTAALSQMLMQSRAQTEAMRRHEQSGQEQAAYLLVEAGEAPGQHADQFPLLSRGSLGLMDTLAKIKAKKAKEAKDQAQAGQTLGTVHEMVADPNVQGIPPHLAQAAQQARATLGMGEGPNLGLAAALQQRRSALLGAHAERQQAQATAQAELAKEQRGRLADLASGGRGPFVSALGRIHADHPEIDLTPIVAEAFPEGGQGIVMAQILAAAAEKKLEVEQGATPEQQRKIANDTMQELATALADPNVRTIPKALWNRAQDAADQLGLEGPLTGLVGAIGTRRKTLLDAREKGAGALSEPERKKAEAVLEQLEKVAADPNVKEIPRELFARAKKSARLLGLGDVVPELTAGIGQRRGALLKAVQDRRDRFLGSEFERNIAHLPPDEQAQLREAKAWTSAQGVQRGATTTLPASTIDQLNVEIEGNTNADSSVNQLISSIKEDPARAGFGATVVSGAQTFQGLLQGVADAFGGGIAERLGRARTNAILDIQGLMDEGTVGTKEGAEFLDRLNDPSIAVNEFVGLILAYDLERALSGGRRFSIQAVKNLEERINLRDARGPDKVLARLGNLRRELRRRRRSLMRRARSLEAATSREQGQVFQFDELPPIGAPPTVPELEAEARRNGSDYIMTPGGQLVPVE